MNDVRVEFTPGALQEIDEAFEWYLERSPRVADSFFQEVESAFALIVRSPDLWSHFEAGTRRYVLPTFPYNIIYRLIPAGVEIVAVAHHKRRPRYWRSRLARTNDS